jgi:predicted TIM-barrel fold metal-dependent hydrolase
MRSGFRVIDADGHVMEPDAMWVDYIDPRLRDRAPRRVTGNGRAWGQLQVDGVPIYRSYPDALVEAFHDRTMAEYAEYAHDGFDPASQVKAMDRQGIDLQFLYPSLGLGVVAIDGQDPELAAAVARAYNTWLAEFCAFDPDRLRGVALVSLHDVDRAVTELTHAVENLGYTAVMLRPNPVNGRGVGHPDTAPFWRRCAELDVSVSFHEGCHTKLPAAGADRFTSHFAMHAACHPMEQIMAFVGLLEGGVLERHPTLRVAFLESGCGWVPYFLWRLDELEYRHWRFQVPELRRPPSEYFRRQCWVSAEGCEPYLARIVADVGPSRLLFASDYPHPDHAFGEEVEDVLSAPVPQAVKEAMFWDNPAAFYGVRL